VYEPVTTDDLLDTEGNNIVNNDNPNNVNNNANGDVPSKPNSPASTL
jgi:hypothetical protein